MKVWNFIKSYKKSVVGILSALLLSLVASFTLAFTLKPKTFEQPASTVAEETEVEHLTPRNQGNWSDHAASSFAGGSGTQASPYQISTAAQLAYLMTGVNGTSYSNFQNKYYILTSDIDLLDYYWTPIGDYNTSNNYFYGCFDGDGHKISCMLIDGSFEYAGLFGNVSSGEIKNVGIEDSEILINTSGSSYVGGIVGESHSTITNCYNSSAVSCTANSDVSVGGIAGKGYSVITNCYNIGAVRATSGIKVNIGGIAGQSSSSITNCYNAGSLSGLAGVSYIVIGGIAGYKESSIVANCFNIGEVNSLESGEDSSVKPKLESVHPMAGEPADPGTKERIGGIIGETDYSITAFNNYYDSDIYSGSVVGSGGGTVTSSGGISGLTEIMKDPESYGSSSFGTYTNQNNVTASATWSNSYPWDFANTWTINSWYSSLPTFKSFFWEDVDTSNVSFSGNGTENSPYLISTAEQFVKVMQEVNTRTLADLDPNTQYPYYKYYKLTADIDLSGKLWTPIGWDFDFLTFVMMTQGYSSQPNDELFHFFYGSFDGNGHKITGANVNGSFMFAAVFAGVLGAMDFQDGSLIMPAVIKNLGLEDSTINSDEFLYCGGLIAGVIAAQVDKCYSTIDIDVSSVISYSDRWGIEFDSYVGGVVAGMQYSDITNCYNTGNIIGDGYDTLDVGGVAGGTIAGTVQNSFNTGNITCARTGGHGLKYGEAGGIVGGTVGTTVSNCYNTGNITSTSDYEVSVGGIVGEPSANGSISKCYNTGAISGNSISSSYSVYVGGIVGQAGDGSITDTFSIGTVSATGGNNRFVSGLVGGVGYYSNLTLSNSYFDSSAYSGNAVDTTGIGTRTITSTGKVSTLSTYLYYVRSFTSTSVYTTATGSTAATYTADDSTTGNATWTSAWIRGTNPWAMDHELFTYPSFKWYNEDKLWKYVDTSSVSFGGGNGSTEATAYEISTALQLAKLMQRVNTQASASYKYYKLTADIDLSGKLWTPIGNYETTRTSNNSYFRGEFDGNGHKITGLNLQGNFKYAGLFGYVYGESSKNAEIKNIVVEGKICTTGGIYIGGIVGYVINASIINCQNKQDINVNAEINVQGSVYLYIGGIVGYWGNSVTSIINCQNKGAINIFAVLNRIIWTSSTSRSEYFYVGGIVGCSSTGNSSIINCRNTGLIDLEENILETKIDSSSSSSNAYSKTNVGGIAGGFRGTISDCQNVGASNVFISSSTSMTPIYLGGIIGNCDGKSSVTNCSNSGFLQGKHLRLLTNMTSSGWTVYVGGVIGYGNSLLQISNCCNFGEINGRGYCGNYVGGILGYGYNGNVQIEKSFAVCSIVLSSDDSSPSFSVGGILGNFSSSSYTLNITECFFEGQIINENKISSNGFNRYMGGLVGIVSCKDVGSSIKDCYVKATINIQNFTITTYIDPWIGYRNSTSQPETISDYYYNATINSKKGTSGYYDYDRTGTFDGDVWYYSLNLNDGNPVLREFYWVAESAEPQDDVKDTFDLWRTITLDDQSATTAGSTSVGAIQNKPLGNITAIPAKTGYLFGGYYTETNGGGTQYYNADGIPVISAYPFDTDLTLYAYWVQSGLSYTDSVNNLSYTSGVAGGSAGLLVSALSSAKSSLTDVTIPETYNGLKVVGVASSGFSSCSNLTTITIPNSVTSIGQSAFSGCRGLTSIAIPNSVTTIGNRAFSGCRGLTSIAIPDSVITIEYSAFEYCSSLTSVTIGDSVTSIGSNAFSGCSGLTSINVDSANLYYSSLNGVLFNKDQTELVMVPPGLTTYTVPSFVKIIATYAFNSSNLTSIILSDSVLTIKNSAFYSCQNLISVNLGNSVKTMEGSVFGYCNNLTSITIPKSVERVSMLYYNCANLKSINVDPLNPNYSSLDGVLYNRNKTKLIRVPGGVTTYTVPDSVTSIGDYAFYYCSSLTSITIPNSVTSIGEAAFSSCSNLTSITIPNSVISIGGSAFYQCTKLILVTIGNSVTGIGNQGFDCSKLNTVYIKSGAIYQRLSSATGGGYLLNKATVIYVDQSVVDSGSYTAGSYLTSNYTQDGTVTYEGTTYYRYIRNGAYKVNLILNGASLPITELYVLNNNSNFTSVPVPTYTGHTFRGWYTTSTFTTQLTNTSGTLTSNVSGFTATSATQWNLSGEVTIYAKWS